MLSLAFYFSGSFAEALQLFDQLTSPDSPLEKKQKNALIELAGFARLERLRQDYWDGLKLDRPQSIQQELTKRDWDPSSREAFHLYMSNGRAADWLSSYSPQNSSVLARMTSRNNQVQVLRECVDADMSIGSYLEAVRGSEYVFVPLEEIQTVELGPVKRWIRAGVEYRDGSWVEMYMPLMYRDSMQDEAHGVREGVETVLMPLPGLPDWKQAFGQKQFRSSSGITMGLAEVSMLEIETLSP